MGEVTYLDVNGLFELVEDERLVRYLRWWRDISDLDSREVCPMCHPDNELDNPREINSRARDLDSTDPKPMSKFFGPDPKCDQSICKKLCLKIWPHLTQCPCHSGSVTGSDIKRVVGFILNCSTMMEESKKAKEKTVMSEVHKEVDAMIAGRQVTAGDMLSVVQDDDVVECLKWWVGLSLTVRGRRCPFDYPEAKDGGRALYDKVNHCLSSPNPLHDNHYCERLCWKVFGVKGKCPCFSGLDTMSVAESIIRMNEKLRSVEPRVQGKKEPEDQWSKPPFVPEPQKEIKKESSEPRYLPGAVFKFESEQDAYRILVVMPSPDHGSIFMGLVALGSRAIAFPPVQVSHDEWARDGITLSEMIKMSGLNDSENGYYTYIGQFNDLTFVNGKPVESRLHSDLLQDEDVQKEDRPANFGKRWHPSDEAYLEHAFLGFCNRLGKEIKRTPYAIRCRVIELFRGKP